MIQSYQFTWRVHFERKCLHYKQTLIWKLQSDIIFMKKQPIENYLSSSWAPFLNDYCKLTLCNILIKHKHLTSTGNSLNVFTQFPSFYVSQIVIRIFEHHYTWWEYVVCAYISTKYTFRDYRCELSNIHRLLFTTVS